MLSFVELPDESNGVARTFSGGRFAHPEDQIEEENDEKMRKEQKNEGN